MPSHYGKQHGSGAKKHHAKSQHGMGKGKRTAGDPAFANRNVKQLRKEAATLRKQHCRTYKMNHGHTLEKLLENSESPIRATLAPKPVRSS